MIRRSTLIALEVLLGLAAALLIALVALWWRLSQGPVEVNFIRQHIQAELSDARSGRPVGIERVELAWSKEASALELRAVGVTVEDSTRQVLSRSDEARIELSALPLLIGRVAVERAEFSGGDISITRKLDGAVHVAFGPPGAPPDIIVPPPPIGETLEARVNRVLDGLQAAFEPVGPGGALKSLAARGVRLVIIDEKGGGRWNADAASVALARQGRSLALTGEARLEGAVDGEEAAQAPATLRITTDTAFEGAIVEFGAQEVRPRALLSPAALGPFAGLDAPLTAQISIGLDRETGVNRFEGEATLGRGVADMAGDQFQVDGGTLRGRYDIASDELIIDQIQLAGDKTSVRGEMRVRDASAIMRARPDEPAAFNISLPAATLDLPGVFAEPVNLSDVQVAGAIVTADRSINLTRLRARHGEAAVDVSGRLYWGEAGGQTRMGVVLNGAVGGVTPVQTVLHMWPLGLGEGARDYLSRALTAGRITDATVRLDVRPFDLAAGQWRNEAVDIRFNFSEADFRFISTLSPLTGARGSAVLRGNRFDLDLTEARLNGLAVSRARLELPRLKPRGGMATVTARAEGEARQMVEVLLQEPIALGDRLPVTTESVVGRAGVNVRFQWPLQNDVTFEQMRFAIDGRIDNFAANMSTRRMALSQGRLDVRGDQRAVTISGPVRAGGSSVNVQWTELLNQPSGASSQYQISGDFDANDLERLGYPVASFAQGRIGVVVSGEGAGFDVNEANIQLDLRNAAVETPRGFWTKRAGVAASASFDVTRAEQGALAFSNINARGGGMVAQGAMMLTRDNRLMSLDLTRLAIEGRSDARLTAQRASDGGLDVRIEGDMFDAAPFMDNDQPEGQAQPVAARTAEPPLRATLAVERLKLRGGATLSNAQVELALLRGALSRLSATGRAPGGGAFSLAMGPRAGETQGRILLRSEDAGFAMRALTGADNIVGGQATAEGVWRPGPPSTAEFTVHMRDFQVVRLPAMARLLSSAGSLTGLVETLNGEGIGFSALNAPVVYANDALRIGESHAAGPSLGITASGRYDMNRNNLDVDGVVVPSYGLNSMLGAVPIFGDLFVSRRGEGVFGMTYSINGPVETPRVGVNPLSALTPGILRRIFEPLQSEEEPAATQAPARTTGETEDNLRGRATAALPEDGAAP